MPKFHIRQALQMFVFCHLIFKTEKDDTLQD